MCIPNQNYLIDALDTVLGWGLPDELLPLALIDQAKLKAGMDCESGFDTVGGGTLGTEDYVFFH